MHVNYDIYNINSNIISVYYVINYGILISVYINILIYVIHL